MQCGPNYLFKQVCGLVTFHVPPQTHVLFITFISVSGTSLKHACRVALHFVGPLEVYSAVSVQMASG